MKKITTLLFILIIPFSFKTQIIESPHIVKDNNFGHNLANKFNYSNSITIDCYGNKYLTDNINQKIIKINNS